MCECINGDGLDCHENPTDECDCECACEECEDLFVCGCGGNCGCGN